MRSTLIPLRPEDRPMVPGDFGLQVEGSSVTAPEDLVRRLELRPGGALDALLERVVEFPGSTRSALGWSEDQYRAAVSGLPTAIGALVDPDDLIPSEIVERGTGALPPRREG